MKIQWLIFIFIAVIIVSVDVFGLLFLTAICVKLLSTTYDTRMRKHLLQMKISVCTSANRIKSSSAAVNWVWRKRNRSVTKSVRSFADCWHFLESRGNVKLEFLASRVLVEIFDEVNVVVVVRIIPAVKVEVQAGRGHCPVLRGLAHTRCVAVVGEEGEVAEVVADARCCCKIRQVLRKCRGYDGVLRWKQGVCHDAKANRFAESHQSQRHACGRDPSFIDHN